MHLDELRAAAERLQTPGKMTESNSHWDRLARNGQDYAAIAKWAMPLLSEAPITGAWLQEHGEWRGGQERLYLSYCELDVCFIPSREELWVGGNQQLTTQGQFLALMFALGQYPKE